MTNAWPMIAIKPDQDDPEDFAITLAALEVGLTARRKRHIQQATPLKKSVSLWLDADLLAALRAQGIGWQARVNDALRKEFLQPQ